MAKTINRTKMMRNLVGVSCLGLALSLLAGCVRLTTVPPVIVPPAGASAPPPAQSHVTIPVEIDNVDLRSLEGAIPPVFGETRAENIPFLGISQVNFLMWRDPLNVRLENSTISAHFHPYFYISVGDAYDPLVQCGFKHETAQERLIGITSVIDWNPAWSLRTSTSWQFLTIDPPPRPTPIPCKLGTGPWEYDANAKLNAVLSDKLNRVAAQVDAEVKKKTNLIDEARTLWTSLTETLQIEPNLHLQLRPSAVNAGPITSQPTPVQGVYNVRSVVELTGSPRLIFGPVPPTEQIPLPDLGTVIAGREGFELFFDSEISFEEANKLVAQEFPLEVTQGNHRVILCNPLLRPSGSKVILELELFSTVTDNKYSGSGIWDRTKWLFRSVAVAFQDLMWTSAAKVYLTGTPTFDVPRRDVWFPDLDFTIESQNVLINGLGWVLRSLVIPHARSNVRLSVAEPIDRIYPALNAALNRPLRRGRLSGFTNEVRPDSLFVTDSAIVARSHASGGILLTVPLALRGQ